MEKLSDPGPAEGVSVSTPLPSCLHDASKIYQFGTIILWPARRILAKSRVSFLSLHYCTTARSILENARLGHDKQRRAPFSSAPDPDTRSKSALHFGARQARTREAKARSILERARPGHEKQHRAPFWSAQGPDTRSKRVLHFGAQRLELRTKAWDHLDNQVSKRFRHQQRRRAPFWSAQRLEVRSKGVGRFIPSGFERT